MTRARWVGDMALHCVSGSLRAASRPERRAPSMVVLYSVAKCSPRDETTAMRLA
jgi:hypothetical protein